MSEQKLPQPTLERTKSSPHQLLMYIAAITLGLLLAFLVPNSAFAQIAYGVVGRMTGGNFYGVGGANTVTNATVSNSYHWVNSVYVRSADGFNGVEIGWIEVPDNVRQAFAFRLYNGSGSTRYLPPTMTVGTSHVFRVSSQAVPGEYQWNYYVDGTKYWAYSHFAASFSQVWAAQERMDPTTGTSTHFWSLQYVNSSGTYYSWYTLDTSYDTDPVFLLCKVSNTEFWVKTSCP